MDVFRRYGNLLRSDGTNQLQRLLPGLDAQYIVPDERTFSDLVEYAYRVAAELRFYDLNGQSTGDWQPLFEALLTPGTDRIRPTEELLPLLASRADWPPHLVLLLAFLKLFQHLQADLNQLTQKHLLHYYEKELGLTRRPPVPDAVHVIFELAQNAPPTRLPAGTLLDAGKDAEGKPLVYATQNELVVSAARIGEVRRLVVERDIHHNRRFFVAGGFTEREGPSGYTFGRYQLDLTAEQRFMTEAPLGFAVAAPILKLAEGEREITLRARLRPAPSAPPLVSQSLTAALDIALTGAEGWLPPDSFQATLLADGGQGAPVLALTVKLGAAAAAVVPFDPTLHGPGMASERPVLRCLVKGASGLYELFDGVTVEQVDLEVDVAGVHGLVVQNDEGALDVNAPMPLFGSQPRVGSVFYVGSSEVFSKRLTRLTLHLDWKSPPEDLFEHYRGYFDSAGDGVSDTFTDSFLVGVDLLYDRRFRRMVGNQPLFNPVTTEPREVSAEGSAISAALAGVRYVEQPDLEVPESFGSQSRYGFVRLVLTEPTMGTLGTFEAFGHSVYAQRYANQAIALSQWKQVGAKPLLPNEPYTPTLSSLSLDYRAKAELEPGDADSASAFHVVGPFGAIRAVERAAARLVPALDGEASLFVGIRDLSPGSGMSLLFEIDPGTASVSAVLKPGDTEWSYFGADDSWRPFTAGSLLVDSTQGFQRSGIIALNVPVDAALEHQSLPSGLVWLRALIKRPPGSAARTLSSRTQASLARLEPGALPLAAFEKHLRSGLAAATISKLVQRNGGIRRVEQPDASFGGRSEEGVTDYIRRGSERLRHRNRAVTAWDLERLVLERFPEIFKVKCLSHTDESGALRAGHTALVIVPNLRRTGGTNVLEPRAGEVLMGEVSEYLADLTTPFLSLHVIRPVFERIRVAARVVFERGRDPGYYSNVLNDELRRFLSPWAYQEGEDILFGARIYRSEILAFIEGREYVDHLVGLRLFHNFAGEKRDGIGWMTIGVDFIVHPRPRPGLGGMGIGDDFIVGRHVEVAETTQAHAILVSHPQHLITPVPPGSEVCAGITRLGIGYMTVGLDFKVALDISP